MAADLPTETGAVTKVQRRQTVRLVVLRFSLLRPDEEILFLEGALPETITTSLSSLPTLAVRLNIAALRSGAAADLGRVARELDVDHLLTGTLLRSGDQLRVRCQLIRAPSGEVR